jgi:hypothetical protein
MSKIIEETDSFTVREHEPSQLYELVGKRYQRFVGIFFSGEDAVKFREMIEAPVPLNSTLNKKLDKIYLTARRNIDRGHPKL